MSRRLLALLTFAAACSAAGRSHSVEQAPHVELSPPPVDSEPGDQATAGVNLSGAWVTGSTNEPAIRRLVLQLQCNYTPSVWVIEQVGDTVQAWTAQASRAQGIARPVPPRPIVATGRLRGARVTLKSVDSRYVLAYDAASGHLRGTLNGEPFWAVRQERLPARDCRPVP